MRFKGLSRRNPIQALIFYRAAGTRNIFSEIINFILDASSGPAYNDGMNKGKTKPSETKSEVVEALPGACTNEMAAVELLEKQRWDGKPRCPHCESESVVQLRDKRTGERNGRLLWWCRDCGKEFTVRVGTVFEDSRIPLRHWCYAFGAACASKKGVSAKQIQRQCQISYKSALFLMHRIRWAMAAPNEGSKLMYREPISEAS